MKLSIIICVYNTPEKYFEECLKSIRESTLKTLGEDYEICMVDDGSTVDYSELTKRYGIRVEKTENRGIFSARRTGAKMARGEYSIYCDSDDTVSFNYYLPMVKRAEETDADIVINDWATHSERARYYARRDETVSTELDLSGDDTLLAFLKNEGRQHSFYVLWNKLYKTSLLLSAFGSLHGIGFPERTSYSEDAALNFFLWRDARRIVNVHTGFYFYRIHEGQTVNAPSAEKLKTQIDAMSSTLRIMADNIGENRHKTDILKHIKAWTELMARAHYSQAKNSGYSELFAYIKESYGVSDLQLSTAKDGICYAYKTLLGDNFTQVDRVLLSICDSEKPVNVTFKKSDKYTQISVKYLTLIGKISKDSDSTVKIPSFEISIKKKLLHNALLYKIGLILFKKGSRARNFLKKFL